MRILALALTTLALTTTAHADELRLGTSPDPMEDNQFTVYADGYASSGASLSLGWAEDGSCDGTPSYADVASESAEGAFAFEDVVSVDDPGERMLCGVLEPWDSGLPATRTSVRVSVRSARANIVIRAPEVLPLLREVRIDLEGSTELGREVRLEIIRGSQCAGHALGWGSGAVHEAGKHVEAGAFLVRPWVRLGDYGQYRYCAFVEEDEGVSDAEAVAEAPLLVTQPCTDAWQRVGRAKGRLRRAHTAADEAWRMTRGLRRRLRQARRGLVATQARRTSACTPPT